MSELFEKNKKGFFQKLKLSFSKNTIDDTVYDELLEALISFDIPYPLAGRIVERAQKLMHKQKENTRDTVIAMVQQAVEELLTQDEDACGHVIQSPAIVLMCGVNGVGKTTTIAKLAHSFQKEGKSVMLVCADTFRAAATEQLSLWAEKLGVPVVKGALGQDPSGVVFDGIASAKSKKMDVVICDSAGRVATKENLMRELEKIYRICNQNKEQYHLYVLLVLDAQNGANSLLQAKNFLQSIPVDGYVMSKVDGAGKGGSLIAAKEETGVDVWFLGVGEGVEDLVPFDARAFSRSLF